MLIFDIVGSYVYMCSYLRQFSKTCVFISHPTAGDYIHYLHPCPQVMFPVIFIVPSGDCAAEPGGGFFAFA